MPLLRVKALTSRQCSGACSRAWVINPRSRPSRIGCADWSGRYFIRESATLNKASDPNRSFSFIEPNPWPNNCASSVTTSKSLLPTVPQHKASGSSYGGGDFRRSRPVFTNPIHLDVKPASRTSAPVVDDKIHYRVRNHSYGQAAANELVSINSERTLTPDQYKSLADVPPEVE
jgi:hypothetical protein